MAKKSNNDKNNKTRNTWGKEFSLLPKLDLLAIQKESYQWFLEKGIKQVLDEISPIDDFTEKNWTLELKDYRIGKTTNTPEIALAKGVTFDAPLYVNATLTNKKTGATYDQEVFLGDIPQMTDGQLLLSTGSKERLLTNWLEVPGVFFTATRIMLPEKLFITPKLDPCTAVGWSL